MTNSLVESSISSYLCKVCPDIGEEFKRIRQLPSSGVDLEKVIQHYRQSSINSLVHDYLSQQFPNLAEQFKLTRFPGPLAYDLRQLVQYCQDRGKIPIDSISSSKVNEGKTGDNEDSFLVALEEQFKCFQDSDTDSNDDGIGEIKKGQCVKSRKRKAENKPDRCYKNYKSKETYMKENDIILDYVEKNGENWRQLAFLIYGKPSGQNAKNLKDRYYTLKDKRRKGPFSLEEDKLLLSSLFSNGRAKPVLDLPESRQLVDVFQTLEEQLGRRKKLIIDHWERIVKPILLQYHAGTLNLDISKPFFNYLVENKFNYIQDIDWDKVLSQPQFAGHTKSSLTLAFINLKKEVSVKLGCKLSEVTVPQMCQLVNDKPVKMKTDATLNGKLYKKRSELINYYNKLISFKSEKQG